MDDDPYYNPADAALRDARQQLEQSRRELAERQAHDGENPDLLNAETDAFLAQVRAQRQEQLRAEAIAGIDRDMANAPLLPRQPPPPEPQAQVQQRAIDHADANDADDAIDADLRDIQAAVRADPRPAPMGAVHWYVSMIGEEVGRIADELRTDIAGGNHETDERLRARIKSLQKSCATQLTELEMQFGSRVGALEARLQAIEAKEAFGGTARKRIVTHRNKDGNLIADVIVREEGNGNDNGYDA